MKKVSESEYLKYVPWAKANTANRVYPCSIAEGFQSGDIYVNEGADVETVLFWHYCGFAYFSGSVSERILRELVNSVCQQDKRRMLLITDAELAIRFFRQKGEEIGRRIEYEYAGQIDSTNMNIDIRKIDSDNIHAITGRIIPPFSWKETEFLNNGCGYIAFDHERYCGTAFSAPEPGGGHFTRKEAGLVTCRNKYGFNAYCSQMRLHSEKGKLHDPLKTSRIAWFRGDIR